MAEIVVVGLIVLGAAIYLVYRLVASARRLSRSPGEGGCDGFCASCPLAGGRCDHEHQDTPQ